MSAPPSTAEVGAQAALMAAPHERVDDAIATVLDDMAAKGLGRWVVTDEAPIGDEEHALCLVVTGVPACVWLSRVGDDAGPRSPDEEQRVLASARLVATLLAQDRQRRALEQRAARAEVESATDALTGVPNSRTWWRTLVQESARCDLLGVSAAIAVIDLNDLKLVNDSAGHLAGDVLLRTAADALTDAMRGHVVARIGGDEFAVLAVDPDPGLVDRLPALLTEALANVGAGASIGVASYEPGGDIERTFDDADHRMYEVKRAERGERRRRRRVPPQKFDGSRREKFSKK